MQCRIRRNTSQQRLSFEALEARRCLAASVTNIGNLNTNNPFAAFSASQSAGDYVYLVADQQLLRTDGTQVGTQYLTDLGNSPNPQLTNFNGNLYFQGFDSTNGFELWRSDGTVAGTALVKNLSSNTTDKTITSLRVFNNRLYFLSDGELFSTDGTAAGTNQVVDLVPGGSDAIANMTEHNSALYFTTAASATLYKSDGTGPGTSQLPNSPVGDFSLLTSTPGSLYFNLRSNSNFNLWRLDDATLDFSLLSLPANAIGELNGSVYFSTNDSFYKLVGASPQRVSYIERIGKFTNFQGTLYFSGGGNFDQPGVELWRSDGTTAGTFMVKDIEPRTQFYFGSYIGEDSNPNRFTVFNGQLYFVANSSVNDSPVNGLWKTDGTTAGTVQVHPGLIRTLTKHNNQLFIGQASSVGSGDQLLRLDTTEQITEVKQSGTGTASFMGKNFAQLNGQTLLFGNAGQLGNELYQLNSDNSLSLIMDITPGDGSTNILRSEVIDGLFYFVAGSFSPPVANLYRTDGTSAGTLLLKSFKNVDDLELVGNQIFISADDEVHGSELWKTDGTVAGTILVKDIAPGNDNYRGYPLESSPNNFVALNGQLYFTTSIGVNRNIWSSDGTEVGTKLALNNQVANTGNLIKGLQVLQNQLYFRVLDNTGFKIARSNGLQSGTTIFPTSFQSVGSMVSDGSTLYFSAKTPAYGNELWRITGSGAPQLLKDINPGANSSDPIGLSVAGGKIYFSASQPTTGRELWQTSGTAASTLLVQDINPGPGDSNSYPFSVLGEVGGVVFFNAYEPVHGNELWQTNGAAAGATLVQEITPGSAGTFFGPMIARSRDAIFSAYTAALGDELWRVQSATPVMTLPTLAATAFRETGPVRLAPQALLEDSDNPTLLGGVLTASLGTSFRAGDQVIVVNTSTVSLNQTSIVVSGTAVGTLSTSGAGRDLRIVFNQNATRARVREVLRAIAFNHTTASPVPGQRSIRFDLTDGSSAQASARVVRVDVVPLDTLPAISGLSGSATSTLNSTGFAFASTAVVTDDNFNLAGGELTVHFNNSRDHTHILISLGNPTFWKDAQNNVYKGSVVIGTMNAGGGVGVTPMRITFNEKVTPAIAQELLRSLKVSTPGSTTAGVRIPWIRISDGSRGFSTPITRPYIQVS